MEHVGLDWSNSRNQRCLMMLDRIISVALELERESDLHEPPTWFFAQVGSLTIFEFQEDNRKTTSKRQCDLCFANNDTIVA